MINLENSNESKILKLKFSYDLTILVRIFIHENLIFIFYLGKVLVILFSLNNYLKQLFKRTW